MKRHRFNSIGRQIFSFFLFIVIFHNFSGGLVYSQQAEPFSADQYLLSLTGNLTHPNKRIKGEAIKELGRLHDAKAIPVLIDLLSIGDSLSDEIVQSLKAISKKDFGENWLDWTEWARSLDIGPLAEYEIFKKDLLAKMDPAFAAFSLEEKAKDFTLQDLFWSGEPKDAAPSINSPIMVEKRKATFLKDEDIIYGIAEGDKAHAYPEKILNWHLIVNGAIGLKSFTLVTCPYSKTVNAYETERESRVITFGFSGLVYQNTFAMYDHQKGNLWNAARGQALTGESGVSGRVLAPLNVTKMTWKAWKSRHPETLVLDINTGYSKDYETTSPFFYSEEAFQADDRHSESSKSDLAKENFAENPLIYGIYLNGKAKAYPLKELKEKGIVNDELGGVNFVLLYTGEANAVYAFLRNAYVFAHAGGFDLKDQNDNIWEIQESQLKATHSDETLKRIPIQPALLTAWLAWFPESQINYESQL